ncbi:MAG: deoxynucleoside kinase [Spirosomaceae bacterium]|nr:deoxynucleoside kinase [Spirosomataceae bacterium]
MHIAITGNIGAGKTSLAEKLAKKYGWEVYYEAVDNNPYLATFYEDMAKWSFHLQVYFLNSRFEQVLNIKKNTESKTIIQDRTIYEDAYIFAENLHESDLLNDTDFATYKGLFSTIMRAVAPPDFMIYLKCDVEKLTRQIKLRNRDYEQDIPEDYLSKLNVLYESFTQKYTHGKLIEIDVNDIDFVNNDADFDNICAIIEKQVNLGKQLNFD